MAERYLPKDKRLLPHEEEEQIKLFNWAASHEWEYAELKMMFHIPNGGKRGKAEAARFKAQGVKAGVPDIFLAAPHGGYHGLFIELKRIAGGRCTAEQKEWIRELSAQGYMAVRANGWEEAREYIRDYLELDR